MQRRYIAKVALSAIFALGYALCCAPIATAAVPEIRLIPDRGACTASPDQVTVQSANFPPGTRIVIVAKLPSGNSFAMDFVGNDSVNSEGKLPATIYLGFCEPTLPDGTIITYEVWERDPYIPGNILLGQFLAATTFTVDSTAGPLPYIPPPTQPPPPSLPNTGQGGMARPSLGLVQFLAGALIGTGIGSYARWRKSSRAAHPPLG